MSSATLEVSEGLSVSDKQKLIQNLEKAREFEHEEARALQRHRKEGPLLKFTNVMKGYQSRFFMLNPETLTLEYFEKEEHKNVMKPRGSLSLAYASVCPSDEDSQTFFVNASSGEVYRLKAADARQRQEWVDRIRTVAHFQAGAILSSPCTNISQSHGNVSQSLILPGNTSNATQNTNSLSATPPTAELAYSRNIATETQSPAIFNTSSTSSTDPAGGSRPLKTKKINLLAEVDNFNDVKTLLRRLQFEEDDFDALVDKLPQSDCPVTCLDRDILEFRAISRANLASLRACLSVLEKKLADNSSLTEHPQPSSGETNNSSSFEWAKASLKHLSSGLRKSTSSLPCSPHMGSNMSLTTSSIGNGTDYYPPLVGMPTEPVEIDHTDDYEDDVLYEEQDLGSVEEHKSVILHIISQMKLGMDLTKVVLPTFILEKRSLLEMFADCMAHPQLFLRISEESDAESRMLAVLEWYLTSFHAGRKGSLAKKPYNPLIGETFHCSWLLHDQQLDISSSTNETICSTNNDTTSQNLSETPSSNSTEEHNSSTLQHRLIYCAEQVSHHPPVTAFYFECPSKHISLNGSIYTKSKFQGISICAAMVGRLHLYLNKHDEEYELALPSVYARSILTVPWVEMCDKVNIFCPQTNYTASIVFHTKPFYGGKLHRVTAEVKNPANVIICKVQGEWNNGFEFEYPLKNTKRLVKVNNIVQYRKRVRPYEQQGCHESRRLWHNVTEALKRGDLNEASKHKHQLEQRQRESEKVRMQQNIPFPVKYFRSNDPSGTQAKAVDSWQYYKLKKSLKSSLKKGVKT